MKGHGWQTIVSSSMNLRVLLKPPNGLSRSWMLSMKKPDNCKHLSVPDQEKLLKLLTEFEDLFDGTLGDWDTEPVSLKLKEGAKPYHGRPFPTPKAHKETLKKEVQRLCELGILKWQPESEWALPSFIVPKQNQTV